MDDKDLYIQKLEKENAYLKELLNKHNISFEPPKEIKQFSLSNNEKINAYLSYFVGRDDIFAYEYYTKDGKRNFSPACKGRYNLTGYCPNRCKECNNKQYLGLNEIILKRHLVGSDTFGIYPLLKGDVTNLLAVDFDDTDFKSSALAFSKICDKHHLDNLIEISSSGLGAHVWLFFTKPIKAAKVRRLGTYLLYEAMDYSKGIDFASFDRMFPSQDYVPTNGYGNLIVLPLQGNKAKDNKTIFVDKNFVPYELKDQINVLLSTKKISEEEIDLLLEEFKKEDIFLLNNKNLLKNIKLDRNDFASPIVIIKQNDIVVPKASLNNRSIKFIYRLGSIPNPDYYEAQRNRRSTYNIPNILRLYKEDESFIYLPRGVYEDLIKVLNFFNIEIDLIDKESQGELIFVDFKGELKDYQKDGLDKLLQYDNGLFVARPSYGKTVTAINLIATLKLNTLIIVPNINLLHQWIQRLNDFLDVKYEYKKEKDKFGQYYGNKKKLTYKIDVASIDSLINVEDEILNKYGIVILDEVHHIGASSYEQVVRRINSKYLYGFTATPKRSDKKERIIYKTIGDIRYQYKDNNDELNKVLIPEFTFFSFSSSEKVSPYSDLVNKLLSDEDRNNRIVNDIKKAYQSKRHILVLTDRIEHINILKEKLSNLDNVYVINGQLTTKEKKDFYLKLKSSKNHFVILSIGKYIGEGFDDKRLDTLFIVSPFRWNGTLEQYVGRIHRDNINKDNVEVHDYIDINVKMFSNMYFDRLRGYKRLGYIIKDNDVIFEKKIYSTFEYQKKLLDDLSSSKKEIYFIINEYDVDVLFELLDKYNNIKILSKHCLDVVHKNISGVYKSNLEINAIVIDNSILWYGGINPFKSIKYDDTIMRINDKSVVENFLVEAKS